MGIGETCEIFQSEGITAVHREELKIRESGTDTEGGSVDQHFSCDIVRA